MTKVLIAGIDFGTSKIRCLIFNKKGRLLFYHSIKTPTSKHNQGYEYHSVKEIWSCTKKF